MLIKWLIFIHVLGAISFFLGHGASAAMAFAVRRETNLDRIRAMLDLSITMFKFYMLSFLVLGLTGLVMPFVLGLWGEGWIWLSIVLMLVVTFWMGAFNEKTYKQLRRLVGLPYMVGRQALPAETPASEAEIRAHIAGINVRTLVLVGYVIPAVVLWLMVFKPF